MFGERHQILTLTAVCAAHSSLHGHSYRRRPIGLETRRPTRLSQGDRWRPSSWSCPNRRTSESAETTPLNDQPRTAFAKPSAPIGVVGRRRRRRKRRRRESAAL